jgi:acyl-coenzyme A thioesterase PaaI-like protein
LTLHQLAERLGPGLRPWFFRAMNLYPPFVGAGIRITHVAADCASFTVEMPLTPLNRNFVGTQFGGSLYAMCDPFFMLILIVQLGPGYVVWDKSAQIAFRKPGKGRVRAHFAISAEEVARIREAVEAHGKAEPTFEVDVLGEGGEIVAHVTKGLWVKRKRA